MSALQIDSDWSGIPGIAHGGYVAGLLAAALDADSSLVRLRRPARAGARLRLERPAPTAVELLDEDALVAEAAAAEVLLHVPAPVTSAEARAATARYAAMAHHPFPRCVCCGPDHPRGLGVFPAPVSGRDIVAAHWTPPQRLADDRGGLSRVAICTALDCPQLWALMHHAPPASSDRVVTTVLETRIERPVIAGAPHVVVGWPLGRDGRRWLAGAAIFGPDGELCAAGRQTAAIVAGWGVPLGRDRWAAAALATA